MVTSTLDPDYLNRAAPPGSMRYFALLYAPERDRDVLAALFVIEAEIRASATQTTHEVAHTRLQWWRAEIDRLINRNAQHPATRIIQAAHPKADFAKLHEMLVAADMDLARMTYNTSKELDAYLERSGGVILEFLPGIEDGETRVKARSLGKLIRRVETLRDLALEARAARVYWPMDELLANGITVEQLRAVTPSERLREVIGAESNRIQGTIETDLANISHPNLRPIAVLAGLHAKLLRSIERANYDVFARRHELGPIEKVWTAWRVARRS